MALSLSLYLSPSISHYHSFHSFSTRSNCNIQRHFVWGVVDAGLRQAHIHTRTLMLLV